jgi:site-specific recombinase XerD
MKQAIDCVKQYLEERKLMWSLSTYKSAVSRFKHFSMDAELVYRRMVEAGYKPYYIKVSFIMFSGYMEWLQAHGRANTNPFKLFLDKNRQLFRNAYEDKYSTITLQEFLSEYRSSDADMQSVLVLIGFAGCRLSELYTFDGTSVLGKGGKRRTIYIPEGITVKKVDLSPHAIRRRLKHNPHAYRKLSADTWFKNGFDLKTVQVLLGHTSLAATQRY